MVGKCCATGFTWDGQPQGREEKLGGMNAYVSGDNAERAILILPDIFGWQLPNARLLADHFAKEANATVYLPDTFDGGAVAVEDMNNGKFSVEAFVAANGKDKLYPKIKAAAEELRGKAKKIGVASYCYGGWSAAQLAGESPKLVDAIQMAHPSLLTNELLDGISVPALLIVPETDPIIFTDDFQGGLAKVWRGVQVDRLPRGRSWLCNARRPIRRRAA